MYRLSTFTNFNHFTNVVLEYLPCYLVGKSSISEKCKICFAGVNVGEYYNHLCKNIIGRLNIGIFI